MSHRLAALPALILLLGSLTSSVALAQPEADPPLIEFDGSALERLCASNAEDDAALATCIEVVRVILAPASEPAVVGETGVVARLMTVIDEAVAAAESADLRAAIDDAAVAISAFDMEAALDEVIGSAEADVQSIIEDIQVLVDGLVDDIEDQEMLAVIEEGIAETRNVVEAAQTWIEENPELVCDTSSLGIGAGAAAVVGLLTESPGLALVAYRETQAAADVACNDVIG